VKALLDTHFLIWLVLGSRRLSEFRWLERYLPWGVSPVSLLEVQYLSEVGRLEVRNPEFTEEVLGDERFIVDEVPLLSLTRHALELSWTRDPFDRLLAAHSSARRVPLCTTDRAIRDHHPLLVAEMRR
jgi:PIN domain nuclease of toxin-antitoxin system